MAKFDVYDNIECSIYKNLYQVNYYMTKGNPWDMEARELDSAIELLLETGKCDSKTFSIFKNASSLALTSNSRDDDYMRQDAQNMYAPIAKKIKKIIEQCVKEEACQTAN